MKNLDYVIRKTAGEMDLPEDQVRIIVEGYWKEVYTKMVHGMAPDKTTLFLRNIGLFTISKFKLNNFIQDKIDRIRGMRKSPKYSQETKDIVIAKKRKKLDIALVYRNIIAKHHYKKQIRDGLNKNNRGISASS